ncbi:anion exchange protein 3 [Callorhinchus milii]|uniref:anion exchange protein 3 n=1 Tax=Callorhinchus milii TaxID=7868 RepID=UPI001C3FB4BC|nr:anion exchange protein 3 [Callorhinchus milii]
MIHPEPHTAASSHSASSGLQSQRLQRPPVTAPPAAKTVTPAWTTLPGPLGAEGTEGEELDKALAIERLGDLVTEQPAREPHRTYNEKDFEFHRHSSHHIHHPLSTRLPPSVRVKRKLPRPEKNKRRKRKKKKTSVPPSEVTPTIQEEDEEDEGEEEEGSEIETQNKETSTDQEFTSPPQFLAGYGELFPECGLDGSFTLLPTSRSLEREGPDISASQGSAVCLEDVESQCMLGWGVRGAQCRGPGARGPGGRGTSYNLRDRTCIGSMTALEATAYQHVPTDEAEAQLLAGADLDYMKSHRFEDNPGVRRHLVKKTSRCQAARTSTKAPAPPNVKKKLDRKPHEVFVELNELTSDGKKEMQWRETARWIKFEEDVETETDKWGKPHVASLSFRSLLELRKTIAHGAVLLDLEQKTLPGIAHLVVETMITSDQIKAEDRANVLRALLLKHSHPNDEKEGTFFPRNHSTSSMTSLSANHHHPQRHRHEACVTVPLMGEEPIELQDKASELDKEKSITSHTAEGHKKSHRADLKLLEKIPENAEATVVLVGSVEFLEQPAMAFVRLSEGVFLESVLEVPVPVRFIFVLLGPIQSNLDYHEIGRSISTLMSDKHFHEAAYMADARQDLLNAINEFLDCSIVIPPSEVEGKDLLKSVASFQKEMLRKRKERDQRKSVKEGSLSLLKDPGEEKEEMEDDPLERTGMPFGGVYRDIKRRYPKYLNDIRDALHTQCLAAVIFIYFAALSPAITFGGLLGEKTEGLIGVSELIISTSVLGIIFCLLGAQPLLVIGFSGPLLVFEEAFYKFCQAQRMEYLTGRVWIGLWLMVIVVITVAFEGSFLVRYITPFTQEIFAFLISIIFIYETFYKLYKVFAEHPLLKTYPAVTPGHSMNHSEPVSSPETPGVGMQPNTALLSLLMMCGTFFVAFFMRKLRNSRFLGGKARRIIGDFGIPIAILVMVLLDYAITDTYTQKLNVPNGFSVTSPDKRDWFIHPLGTDHSFPMWMMFASAIPALLVFILIFMETNITTLIVSKKERKLERGSGFHLDLLLIGVMGGLCALFGLPWLTAATVRSVTHVNALTVMSKAVAPGEKPRIEDVKEQRITGILVAGLVGLSIVMGEILRLIPLSVLFGIFLYMGVTSLTGIQLYERTLLMFTPTKHHPDHTFVTKVKTWRMNLFTGIQLACIVVLWVVKSTVASLAFPFILILTVPLRHFLLTRIFQDRELKALDSDDLGPNFDEDGHDEYNEMHMPV